MRFLCISDIHGHAAALDAVIKEADSLGWDQLVACGDLCFPGPAPLAVWKTLLGHRALCVQGVGDRAHAQIDPNTLSAVHGSPLDASEPFTAEMSDDELIALLGDEPGDLIVCGGSHVPFDRTVADVRVINVGSVGEAPGGGYANFTIVTTSALGINVAQH